MSETQKFYHLKKFKFAEIEKDEETKEKFKTQNKHLKLSFCRTCHILRPPRSFHCQECGICVEVHDHHCHWVGACIGHRNSKYFIFFLLSTSFHSLVLMILSIYAHFRAPYNIKYKNQTEKWDQKTFLLFFGLANFTFIFWFVLFIFAIYNLKFLIVQNVTTNESIRSRWNGHPSNFEATSIFISGSSNFDKIKYYLTRDIPDSNLEILG